MSYKSRAKRLGIALDEIQCQKDLLQSILDDIERMDNLEEVKLANEEALKDTTDDKEKDEIQTDLDDINQKSIDQQKQIASQVEKANGIISSIEWGKIESLKDEMENWMDGLQGTNLENSSKYQLIEEVVNNLSEALDGITSLSIIIDDSKEEAEDGLQEALDILEEAIQLLDNVKFPGMYS